MSAEPWVSVDEVAKHLSVAKDSIHRWIEHKGLPAHKARSPLEVQALRSRRVGARRRRIGR